MKKSILMLMATTLIGTLVCCGNNESDGNNNSVGETVVITDSVGVEVEVPKNCDEIICVWPSGTQLLVALGMGDLLVGVSDGMLTKPISFAVASCITLPSAS